MRRFHSYGPVNSKYHFCVERKEIIEKCKDQLTGIPEEGGHFYTIWPVKNKLSFSLVQLQAILAWFEVSSD